MALTVTPEVAGGGKVKSVWVPNIATRYHGLLETYACLSCGFVEWYCQDPESVPIGPEYMTELVDCGPQQPYR